MITSILSSHDDELQVNGAFANISLIASKVWAYDREDTYRKLNQSLWLQNCKLSETYNGKSEKTMRVRDVIPASRLAQYGNYEYSLEREKMYNSEGIARETWKFDELPEEKFWHEDHGARRSEPWMLKQVEECFIRLSSSSQPTTKFLSPTKYQQFYEQENGKYVVIPYTIDDSNESQLQARISSKVVKDLWSSRRRSGDSTSRGGQRSSTPGLHDPRVLNDEGSIIQREEKIQKIRHRHGAPDKRTEMRKNFQQSSFYGLRNDRAFNAKRASLLYPLSTTSSSIIPSSSSRPIVPLLSPEVAEFFPKGPAIVAGEHEDRQGSIQFFPSSAEPSYKDELFPYNQGHFSSSSTFTHNTAGLAIAVSHPTTVNTWIRAPHQWIHRIGPPIHIQVPGVGAVNHQPIYSTIQPFCPTIVHRPINLHEKIFTPTGQQGNTAPIPVYQRPAELYQEGSQRRGKNHQGVDFNNLILLTKNAMKARRNQSKNPQRASSFILESRQPNLKSESDVLQWLNKGYPKRAREFGTVNSLVSELTRFEGKFDCTVTMGTSSTSIGQLDDEVDNSNDATSNIDRVVIADANVPTTTTTTTAMLTKKRLYRDVLTNTASRDIIDETLLDKRYDELEQQAMEQYRTSEECLAIRYQELERQGLEQYKYGDSSSESIRAICSSTLCSGRHCSEETATSREKDDEGNDSSGSVIRFSSSGFEKRSCCNISPGKEIYSSDGDKAGPATERPITILRSDIKCASVNSNVGVHGSIGQQSSTRGGGTTVVTKSLTALNQASLEIRSKDPIKGASGDKIEEQVQSSTNNGHLIVLSHLKKKIPSMRTDVITERPITAGYRGESKIANVVGIPSGGGDEKVTILRSSPGAQVWLSSFWR